MERQLVSTRASGESFIPLPPSVPRLPLVPLRVKYLPWEHNVVFLIFGSEMDSRPETAKKNAKLVRPFSAVYSRPPASKVAHMYSPPVTSCFSSAGIARRSHTRWNICRPFSVSWGHFPYWLSTPSPLHFNSSLKIRRREMFQKAAYSTRLVSVSFLEKYMPPPFFPLPPPPIDLKLPVCQCLQIFEAPMVLISGRVAVVCSTCFSILPQSRKWLPDWSLGFVTWKKQIFAEILFLWFNANASTNHP